MPVEELPVRAARRVLEAREVDRIEAARMHQLEDAPRQVLGELVQEAALDVHHQERPLRSGARLSAHPASTDRIRRNASGS